MDGAEVYMLMIRKSGLPILGEAMAPPFNQQVEVLKWGWKINNAEEVKRRKQEDARTELAAKSDYEIKLEFDVQAEDIRGSKEADNDLLDVLKKPGLSQREQLRMIQEIQEKSAEKTSRKIGEDLKKAKSDAQSRLEDFEKDKSARDAKDAARNLEFRFSKRVDFASTQMLNCMKAGEILPRVVITIFHRSTNAKLSVTVTAQNLRFTKYDLSVELDETMADMQEEWEAEFTDINFAYLNMRHTAEAGRDPAKMARALKQQQNAFSMKSRD